MDYQSVGWGIPPVKVCRLCGAHYDERAGGEACPKGFEGRHDWDEEVDRSRPDITREAIRARAEIAQSVITDAREINDVTLRDEAIADALADAHDALRVLIVKLDSDDEQDTSAPDSEDAPAGGGHGQRIEVHARLVHGWDGGSFHDPDAASFHRAMHAGGGWEHDSETDMYVYIDEDSDTSDPDEVV